VLALLLVAASVGLSNLAAAIGIGFGGVTARTRVRVALTFGIFEAGMPIVGLVIGAGVASGIGHVARWIGAAVLIGIGAITVIQAWRQPAEAGQDAPPQPAEAGHDEPPEPAEPGRDAPRPGQPHHTDSLGRLIISAFALSLDNLAAGFALGTMHIGVAEGAIVIGVVSVVLSLAGLELGGRIGTAAGRRGEQIGGAILVAVGVALAAGVL
jgi:manganese efflux pump family protein